MARCLFEYEKMNTRLISTCKNELKNKHRDMIYIVRYFLFFTW